MTQFFHFKRSLKYTLAAGCAIVALAATPMGSGMAFAEQGSGQGKQMQGGQGGKGAGGGHGQDGQMGQGGQGKGLGGIFRGLSSDGFSTNIETKVLRGKGERVIIIIEEDDGDESDRPDWAGVPGGEGRPGEGRGAAGNENAGGDIYGDLIVLQRDPETGEPVVDEETGQLIFLTDDGNWEVMVDGEVPPEFTPVEVEFGRASVARSPDNVTDRSTLEAISALTADGVVIDTDAAGRIVYTTADGVTSTIDSPLENLGLYIALTEALAGGDDPFNVLGALGDLATLETAASLFAAVADKTGEITLDYLVYQNEITGVVEADEFYVYDGFTYDREYPTVDYFYLDPDTGLPKASTIDLNVYLEDVNGALPDGDAALFAAAADDALEVIEFLHTQIHPGILPGDDGE